MADHGGASDLADQQDCDNMRCWCWRWLHSWFNIPIRKLSHPNWSWAWAWAGGREAISAKPEKRRDWQEAKVANIHATMEGWVLEWESQANNQCCWLGKMLSSVDLDRLVHPKWYQESGNSADDSHAPISSDSASCYQWLNGQTQNL